jgi:tRNA threonylcarbamoyladenosine biosynthesis protein TsaB
VIVLAIDTSTPATSVALGSDGAVLGSATLAGRARQETVAVLVERLLGWTGVELGHVGGVAVGLGPGLFTGLRVGVQTAKTLAQVLKVPIVGITSLDALAYGVRFTPRAIAAVIDARRGEVFYALYEPVPGGVMRTGGYEVAAPQRLAADLEALGREVLAVGDGALRYRGVLEGDAEKVEFASPAFAHPRASALVELAVPRFLREEHDRLHEVVPFYLRRSDAEIAWDERRGA